MSGIAGIIHFDGKPVEQLLIEKMTGAMAHRGPDGTGNWVDGSIGLGQCMLRTTPESLEEHQPLTNEDESIVLVMNGRLDSWEELRRDLVARGALLRNRSDAELVLRSYEAWGKRCLSRIDGDFALVIWDARNEQVFCARDRMGNKPFNYHWDGRTFVFASELHAILTLPWVEERLNEGLVAEFLAEDWRALDETFWHGIQRLPAAHQMQVGSAGPRLYQYWAPDPAATLPCTSDEDHVGYYRTLLFDVVRRMSRSCQPVACTASGGLDSSAIFAVAEHLRLERNLLAPYIEGYVLDFSGDPEADEMEYARAVGQHLGASIHEIHPSKEPLSWYRRWASLYREFPGYPNGVMGYDLRKQARERGNKVLLSGIGGDEWLGGSRSYYAEALSVGNLAELVACVEWDRQDVGTLRALWWALRHGIFPLLPDGARRLLGGLVRLLANRAEGEIDREAFLSPGMRRLLRKRREGSLRPSSKGLPRIGQRAQELALYGAYSMLARELEERMASSLGIELRRPYLDPRLVQFAFSTPTWLRRRGNTNKYLHRRAMRGLLPDLVLDRVTKAEFSSSFRGHLPELRNTLSAGVSEVATAWLGAGSMAKLIALTADSRQSDSALGMLWELFGCDAVLSRREHGMSPRSLSC